MVDPRFFGLSKAFTPFGLPNLTRHSAMSMPVLHTKRKCAKFG